MNVNMNKQDKQNFGSDIIDEEAMTQNVEGINIHQIILLHLNRISGFMFKQQNFVAESSKGNVVEIDNRSFLIQSIKFQIYSSAILRCCDERTTERNLR